MHRSFDRPTVRSLLVDGRTWPQWASGLDELVESHSSGLGPHGQDAVGTVRAFRTGRAVTAERLTGLVENQKMTYEDVFNPRCGTTGPWSTWNGPLRAARSSPGRASGVHDPGSAG
ncbi:hypothetical protein TUSST3_37650 [Streptomyces sp. TUS-ST3]|nr:hypothetical protein TUSST3_37650 [Streptomyces sp. TUS-ST3]